MFGNMLEKLKTAKEEIDRELSDLRIEEELQGIRVIVNGHKKLIELKIHPSLMAEGDAEILADLITTTLERAQERANTLSEDKMRQTAGILAPGFPGL